MASLNRFRNTQTPSKVVHLRNLPWECTEEELIELCKPFGDVVNTKSNVGANHNQAFVEFVDMNQAMQMISYYASSSEPAKVRGRSVYLQYSNRQEIVNSKSSGDGSGNVLLVTIEGAQAGDVSIDVLHLVFSAFGFVHKITTFEKAAGFQALVQFSDGDTAASAKQALDGRSIPRYLLPEHVGSYHLHISFSAYTDLNVKFQSHRSRDYTNPYLPVAPAALDANAQFMIGPDGKRVEPSSNVLLASLENMQYAVTIDVIHTVFSAFGTVQKIAMFEKNGTLQALVQYPDLATAVTAKEALEGHCIYEGGFCKLHLSFSHHSDLNVKINSDWSRDYTAPSPAPGAIEAQRPPSATNPSQQASGAWPSNSGGSGPPSTFPGGQQYFGGSSAEPHDNSNIASAAAQPQYPPMDYSRQMPPPPSQGFPNAPPMPEPWGQMATPTPPPPPPPSMYGGGSFIPPVGAGPSRGMLPNFQSR